MTSASDKLESQLELLRCHYNFVPKAIALCDKRVGDDVKGAQLE